MGQTATLQTTVHCYVLHYSVYKSGAQTIVAVHKLFGNLTFFCRSSMNGIYNHRLCRYSMTLDRSLYEQILILKTVFHVHAMLPVILYEKTLEIILYADQLLFMSFMYGCYCTRLCSYARISPSYHSHYSGITPAACVSLLHWTLC